jgi:hypothetical protein
MKIFSLLNLHILLIMMVEQMSVKLHSLTTSTSREEASQYPLVRRPRRYQRLSGCGSEKYITALSTAYII